MSARPLCFVLMPAGRKPDGFGGGVDFDAVYREVVQPAVDRAGLDPLRDEEDLGGGIVGSRAFERLILCEYAIADLTAADANVFYELGVRHATRPFRTVLLAAEGRRTPLELAPDQVLTYRVDAAGGPVEAEATARELVERLDAARTDPTDSPVFELLEGFTPPDIARLKTDVFRDRVQYSRGIKQRLAAARESGFEAVRDVDAGLGPLEKADSAVVIDLFLSYRAVGTPEGWQAMVDMVERMPAPLAGSSLVQEQLGLALNRLGRSEEAAQVLTALVARRGTNSETCAILGRVYKDQWARASDQADDAAARRYLDQAIASYLRGFESDWRDAYAGINAVTLMEIRDPPDPRARDLIPVVRYSVSRRLASGRPDYWDHATLVELAVLGRDRAAAEAALVDALAAVREPWEPESTANNLAIIRRARERRGQADGWAKEMEDALLAHEPTT